MEDIILLQEQYNKLREHILKTAIGLLKSFSTLELEEVSKKIEQKSPITFTLEEKNFIKNTLITHFNDWCVARKEAEAEEEIEKLDCNKKVPKGLTDTGKQKIVLMIQKNLKQLQACIYEFYIPSHTSAYNDFISRSTEDIMSYFVEYDKMDFFQLNQFKKDIIELLEAYLSNFDDSYHQIYRQYFFKLEMELQAFLNSKNKKTKSEMKKTKKILYS